MGDRGSSVYDTVTTWVEQHFGKVAFTVEAAVIGLWIASAIIPWMRSAILGGSFFNVVIVFLVVDILRRVVSLQISGRGEPSTAVAKNQADVEQVILKRFDDIHPRKADLITYSGTSMRPLLKRLKEAGASIRILVCDPSSAVNPTQEKRIKYGIDCLRDELFVGYENVEARSYRKPASVRGIDLDGKLVSIGWYTYSGDALEVHGEDNPVLISETVTPDGARLESLFRDAFRALWDHKETRPIEGVGKRD